MAHQLIFQTTVKSLLADAFTPVGIYLRLRDRFRDTILLESTDYQAGVNSFSYIGIQAIAGIEIRDTNRAEYKLPGEPAQTLAMQLQRSIPATLDEFLSKFGQPALGELPSYLQPAAGFFGYTSYDAIPFFETIALGNNPPQEPLGRVPLMRYRMYQYVIVVDHFRDMLYFCENHFPGLTSEAEEVLAAIRSRDLPTYPFQRVGEESSNLTDEAFEQMVQSGIQHCLRGDVFQLVMSRAFTQAYRGDEFNVYRALRSINPSPYLFYFDYGDYRLLGSSPESQLHIQAGVATVNPIAGTVRRTGNAQQDEALTAQLQADEKEAAEHVMLVDLARNDLSRVGEQVEVAAFREVHAYSHVIHLVSAVRAKLHEANRPFHTLAATFPAGTLSGAPKFRAMELIETLEPTARGFYGGTIGMVGIDGRCNQAIMIRSMMARNNTLWYQAGAGVVAASKPSNELAEVNHKLGALKQAILRAENLHDTLPQ